MRTPVGKLAVLVALVMSSALAAAQEEAPASKLAPRNARFDLKAWGLRAKWRQDVVQRIEGRIRALHCTGKYVVAETEKNRIFCIDNEQGTWENAAVLRAPLLRAPVDALEGQLLLVVDSTVYPFTVKTAELGEAWRPGLPVHTRPILHKRTAIVTSAAGRIAAVDLETGTREWTARTKGVITYRPLAVGLTVLTTGYGAEVTATGVVQGVPQWTWKPQKPAKISSGLAADEENVYVGDNRGHIYALNIGAGGLTWQIIANAAIEGQPRMVGKKLLVLTRAPGLNCVEVVDDAPRITWTYAGAREIVATVENTAYVRLADGIVAAVSIENGKELWRDRLPDDCMIVGDADKGVFYVSDTQVVVAFGPPED